MDVQCFPIAMTPGMTELMRDFADAASAADPAAIRRWYPGDPFGWAWAQRAPELETAHRQRLAELLTEQAKAFGAGQATLENIERLREGAAAVVTGQQVALFGGPLLTLLKAATAIRKAKDATERSGRQHVPVFWLATEDHDLEEVDQFALLSKTGVETLRLGLRPGVARSVGALAVDGGDAEGRAKLEAVLERVSELLGWAPVAEAVRAAYAGEQGVTLAQGFARLLTKTFAEFGLIVMDASSRPFHALGALALRAAVERAEELEAALIARAEELVSAGYHAQVLVAPEHSLLFLIDAESRARVPLRRAGDGQWKAGQRSYSTEELLAILEAEPERLSPNALLRPVFQDAILPTAAYVAGPAEIAYFAQAGVVYERVLGRVTTVLPRLSATLIEPAIAKVMEQHELEIPQVWEAKTADALAQRLGARAMPIEMKQKLAAAGNSLDEELTALTETMAGMNAELGRAAEVSASKMRYQMNRLRTMAANFEVQREASLRKHANALILNLLPDGHLQERVVGGVWFMARYGEELPRLLVELASQECPGHRVIYL
jgi:bacillithiol biosynthesis cysteine-adding enzyme BshC